MSEINFTPEEIAAVKELVGVAVALKQSGTLGLLKAMAENGDHLLETISEETELLRVVAVGNAALEPVRELETDEVIEVEWNTEELVRALLKALAKTDPKEAPKVGMTAVFGYLRDEDVQKGLGFLLTLAKNLGAAMNGKL
ncbi:DUF1641 domain-containing protein [Thermococcus sp. Bubb.Bath]|uniref:DUF1641 domain-containing protein n=1 Tax=Thermococcus sp. Bubb.Bath TaxID=1638242 RepID=UPI00143CA9ED|nr:DUF1641 domain-containing protein [Thermococcus sp. Bubb.Bath]NJF24209.1 DUF1641 domain-containing protein [Thermococcus sp. Bubb.Bath]